MTITNPSTPAPETPPVRAAAPPRQATHTRRPRRSPWPAVALTIVVVASLLPFWWAGLTAVKPFTSAFTYPPTWTFTPQTTAFVDLWEATDFVSIFLNTMLVAAATVIVSLVIGAPAAYALSRYPGPIGAWLLVLALVFRSLPRFAVVLPFYNLAQALGLYDTNVMLVIALVAINQPFTLWLLRNFFAAIPDDIEEAAMVDGCTRRRAFRSVVLPLAGPGLLTAGIFTFLLAYQEYVVALALTQIDAVTLPVFIASIGVAEDTSLFQVIAAASVVLAVPILLIALFAQRYLVAGLTGGAVKG